MDALTIHEAAETTGWSPRMLRYIERSGLVAPARSASGYRLYGAAELQRLRTLRELLQRHELNLSDLGFALRLGREAELREAIDDWFASEPHRPDGVAAADWLSWEQDKHEKLLAAAGGSAPAAVAAAGGSAPAEPPMESAPADSTATNHVTEMSQA
jgi:MerR family transcriptional regulator, copper efflux regulator